MNKSDTSEEQVRAFKEVKERFLTRKLTSEDLACIESMRGFFADVAVKIIAYAPDCRERSLALTELETAKFWTNQAIARRSPLAGKDGAP